MLARVLIIDSSPVFCEILKKSLLAVAQESAEVQIEVKSSVPNDRNVLDTADFIFASQHAQPQPMSNGWTPLVSSDLSLPEQPCRLRQLENSGVGVFVHAPHSAEELLQTFPDFLVPRQVEE